MDWIKAHAKAVVAAVGFVAAAVGGVATGGIHGVVEWTVVAVALANAVQTYVTPNLAEGSGRFAKQISAVVLAVAGVLTPALLAGGVDANERWVIASAVAGALGVLVVPNVGARVHR